MPTEGKASSPPASAAVRWIEVTEDEAGQRIDNYLLARLKGVPKSHIYRILRGGEVRINSKRVEASRTVAAGDRIRVPPVRVAARGEPRRGAALQAAHPLRGRGARSPSTSPRASRCTAAAAWPTG